MPTSESAMKSSPDTEEMLEFTEEEEVEKATKRTKINKTHGMDGITSDNIKTEVTNCSHLSNIFINMLKIKQIPDRGHEAKIVILYKKGGPKDSRVWRLSVR